MFSAAALQREVPIDESSNYPSDKAIQADARTSLANTQHTLAKIGEFVCVASHSATGFSYRFLLQILCGAARAFSFVPRHVGVDAGFAQKV